MPENDQSDLLSALRQARSGQGGQAGQAAPATPDTDPTRFDTLPAYRQKMLAKAAAARLDIASPFFRQAEAVEGTRIRINGQWVENFTSYDYLSLNRSTAIAEAVARAARDWGGSATASRVAGGECAYHTALETALAGFIGAEAALTLVSGHATNETLLRTLLGPDDLVVLDEFCHNSIYEGAHSCGAHRVVFRHGKLDALEEKLAALRHRYRRALIVVEGLYSLDGDTPDLARLVDIKTHHRAWLMVDEAHSLGVLGATGRGLCEAQGVARENIDITMATLSKALCSCGGVVAGCKALIEVLQIEAPASLYSVALPPSAAAAAETALGELEKDPQRVARLQHLGRYFHQAALAAGLDCGQSEGHAIAPVIIGDSLRTAWVSDGLLKAGFAVNACLAPSVRQGTARLRFFLNTDHREESIDRAVAKTTELIEASRGLF